MPSMRQIIRTWWKHIILILFIICWFLVTNYWLSFTEKLVSLLVYAIVFSGLFWMLFTTTISIRFKPQLIARFHRMKPGSKPFEYLFFIFLFIASYYVTYLFSTNVQADIVKFFEITFILFFIVFGAFSFGWLHYMERIEG